MADPRGGETHRRLPPHLVWVLVGVVAFLLGVWGFHDLRPPGVGNLTPLDVLYRTVRLFTLNLDLPDDATAPWTLWTAAILAPTVTIRGFAALFKNQIAGLITAYCTWPRVVVFGANTAARTLIEAEGTPGWVREAIVVVDPDPVALATITAPRVRKVTGDGTSTASLAKAGVRRAAAVVVSTGDHVRNSAITTQILLSAPQLFDPPSRPLRLLQWLLRLSERDRRDLFVEVEGYGLAGVLEQGGRLVGMETTPFNAPACAMETVLDRLETRRRTERLQPLLAAADGAPSTVAVFGTGVLVDAAVLELYRRRRLQLLEDPDAARQVPRVLLFGPDAQARREALMALLGTELAVLEIDASDVRMGQLVELDMGTARQLARHRPRQVLLVVPGDPDSGIAVAIARHLGPAGHLTVVNGSAQTPIADEIERQAKDSPLMSPVTLHRVPPLVYPLRELRRERRADRLAAVGSAGLRPAAERIAAAEELEYPAGNRPVMVRRDALAELRFPHLALLAALGLEPGIDMVRAGLAVDVENPDVLVLAARALLAGGAPAAFAAWCEVARLRATATGLSADVTAATVDGAPGPADVRADIRDLLELRRAVLRDPPALGEQAGDPDTQAAGRVIVLLPGPDDPARAEFLRYTWKRLPPDFVAWTTGLPDTKMAEIAADEHVVLHAIADRPTARRRAIAVWRTTIASGQRPAQARVVALPGADVEEILIARALGARVGRVETGDPACELLGGSAYIVPLPDDRMTVRAFLRRSTWPAELPGREQIARNLHGSYVQRHRSVRKDAGDPVLAPWDGLSAWLQDSNRAVIDDVPDKMASLGYRLVPAGTEGAVDVRGIVAADRELLAEQEHGRFTAERLTSGWAAGVRDPARFMSPHLVPWDELDEEAKKYDHEVVEDVLAAVTEAGIKAVRWAP